MGVNKILVFVILFFLLVPASLIAGGNPEKGLPKVDRLIKEKNYNEAILELAAYMKENPDDFDGAQRRIKRIIELRDTYNLKGMDLLLVLKNEPTNDQKKLDMITLMESLEKNPNKQTRDFILSTKAAAQFTYYRAKFEEIMSSGAALIDKGLYTEAARKYTEGYVFYKQEFDDGTDAETLSLINGSLGQIISSITTFTDMQISFKAAVAACIETLGSGDIDKSEAAFIVLNAEMARFSRFRNLVADSGWVFTDTFASIQKGNDQITENSFLPFAQRFTMGRKAATRYEGVLGAIDAQWNASLNQVEMASDTAIRRQWLSGYDSLDQGNAVRGSDLLDTAKRFASLGKNIASTGSLFTTRADTFGIRDYTSAVKHYADLDTLITKFSFLSSRYTTYMAIKSRLNAYTGDTPNPDFIRKAPSATVVSYSGFIGELAALSREIDSSISSAVSAVSAGAAQGVLSPYIQEIETFRQQFSASVFSDTLGVYRNSALFQENSVKGMVTDWQGVYNGANGMLEGVAQTSSSVLLFYPTESIVVFNRLRSGIVVDRKAVLDAVSQLKKVPQGIQDDSAFALSVKNMEAAVASLDALYSSAAAGIAKANSRILQANLARQESDLRFAQSQSALKKLDFQSARDNLQRSRDKVNQSLALQESTALRSDSDTKIEKLGQEITRIENESVVREVRSLISSGKNFYYLGNFDQAEQLFTQAKTRWAVTNITANPEVTNWLDIINTALSMKTGRTIPVSDPLFPQMSQILSSATELFTEGQDLMTSAQKGDAIVLLSAALTKLQQLQLVYPINQDAGQLTLKINQVIDPASFNQAFKQQVDYIRANYVTEKQKAYSTLLDLYQINPNYPGIKKLVDDVEIYLKIKIPPPDPKALASSLAYTKSAQKIYDANTRSQFQVALNQLDEAIKLNPDNQAAIALKDRIQTSGAVALSVAVLPADLDAKYQQAVQELQKGNKITASALVEQLMQNPKSRNSAKIQDLKKRIDSQL